MKRREFLTAGALAAGGALLTSRLSFAGRPTAGSRAWSSSSCAARSTAWRRCQPTAIPDTRPAAGDLAIARPGTDGGALPLDDLFGAASVADLSCSSLCRT